MLQRCWVGIVGIVAFLGSCSLSYATQKVYASVIPSATGSTTVSNNGLLQRGMEGVVSDPWVSSVPLDEYVQFLEKMREMQLYFSESGVSDDSGTGSVDGIVVPQTSVLYGQPGVAKISPAGLYMSPNLLHRSYIISYIAGHKSEVEEFWHNHMNEVMKHVDAKTSCADIDATFAQIAEQSALNDFARRRGVAVYINDLQFAKILACYMNDYDARTVAQLSTSRTSYREYNISTGLGNLQGYVRKPGQTISAYERVFAGNPYYRDGKALRQVDGKVEEFDVVGGGLCGVSTIMYQAGAKTKNVAIVERHPHSNRYTSYYGKTFGLDATIFGNGARAYKDLKMRNDSGQTILIRPYHYTTKGAYVYGLELISPHIKEDAVYTSNAYRSNGKRCVVNTVKGKKIYSCYHNTY